MYTIINSSLNYCKYSRKFHLQSERCAVLFFCSRCRRKKKYACCNFEWLNLNVCVCLLMHFIIKIRFEKLQLVRVASIAGFHINFNDKSKQTSMKAFLSLCIVEICGNGFDRMRVIKWINRKLPFHLKMENNKIQ